MERGPIRDNNLNYPKDENNRHFSNAHYIRKLSNGEKHDRNWLVYSKKMNKAYYFCCKLFNSNYNTSQLANEGSNN